MASPATIRRQRKPVATGEVQTENKNFREFGGLNTQAARQSINDNEWSWIENVMPIGFANARAVNQISASKATIPAARTIYYRKVFNRIGTNYLFCACTDGSAWQVLLGAPWTVTQIAANGTFSGSATQIAQWKNERILIIDPNANGYRDWDGTTLTILSGTSSAPSGGTCIATFAGRVWIVQSSGNGRTIAYSTANAYADFGGTGGTTTITDQSLTSSIQQFLVANNFLYFFGVNAIFVIADVQVVGGVAQFSITNIVANSGTTFPQAVFPYYRSVWYMNESGIFALYGATPRKASDALDGILDRIDFTSPVIGGTVTIYNTLCAAFLFTYDEPSVGERQLMAIYFNKKWFLASQSTEVTGFATRSTGTDTLFGTLGADVYQMFEDEDAEIDQRLQTKLWDMGDFFPIKQSLRIGIENVVPGTVGEVTATVDTEINSEAPSIPLANAFAFTWYNSGGDEFTWENSLNQTFTWLTAGYIWFQADVENYGHYLGATLESSTAQNIFSGIQLQYRKLPASWGN